MEHFRDVERAQRAERRRKCGTTAHLRVDFRRAPTGCRDGPLSTKGRSVVPEAADVGLAPRRDGRHRSRDGHPRVRLFARRRRIRRKVHDGRPQGPCVNAQLGVPSQANHTKSYPFGQRDQRTTSAIDCTWKHITILLVNRYDCSAQTAGQCTHKRVHSDVMHTSCRRAEAARVGSGLGSLWRKDGIGEGTT